MRVEAVLSTEGWHGFSSASDAACGEAGYCQGDRGSKNGKRQLEQNINAKEVEIHRPVKQVTKGESVELSDDEVGSR